VLEVQKIINT